MCLASSLWARIGHVYFAADRHDAADAGFDDALFYEYFDPSSARTLMPVAKVAPETGTAVDPFDAWQANLSKITY